MRVSLFYKKSFVKIIYQTEGEVFLANEFPDCSFMLRPLSVLCCKQKDLAERRQAHKDRPLRVTCILENGTNGYSPSSPDGFRRGELWIEIWLLFAENLTAKIPSLKLTL